MIVEFNKKGGRMPKIKVEIWWDLPKEKVWLNTFNIETALNDYCKNTKFKVRELKEQNRKEIEE